MRRISQIPCVLSFASAGTAGEKFSSLKVLPAPAVGTSESICEETLLLPFLVDGGLTWA